MKLVITTSSGERTAWSPTLADTFSTKTRSTGPDKRVPERHVVHHASVDEPAPAVHHDGEDAGECRAREQRGLQRSACDDDLFAGVEVGRDHAQRDLEIGERASRRGVVDQRREAVVVEEMRAASHDVPRAMDAPAGKDVVGLELLPYRRELRDAREVGRVGDRRPVERAGRGPDDDVGHDAPFEERAQHPDLADALVATARQDERGTRSRRGGRGARPVTGRKRQASFPWSVHRPVRGVACGGSRRASTHDGTQAGAATVPPAPFDTVRHRKTAPAYTPPDPETTRQRKRA